MTNSFFYQKNCFGPNIFLDQKKSLGTNKKVNSVDPTQKFEALLEFDTEDPNLISIFTIIRYLHAILTIIALLQNSDSRRNALIARPAICYWGCIFAIHNSFFSSLWYLTVVCLFPPTWSWTLLSGKSPCHRKSYGIIKLFDRYCAFSAYRRLLPFN